MNECGLLIVVLLYFFCKTRRHTWYPCIDIRTSSYGYTGIQMSKWPVLKVKRAQWPCCCDRREAKIWQRSGQRRSKAIVVCVYIFDNWKQKCSAQNKKHNRYILQSSTAFLLLCCHKTHLTDRWFIHFATSQPHNQVTRTSYVRHTH